MAMRTANGKVVAATGLVDWALLTIPVDDDEEGLNVPVDEDEEGITGAAPSLTLRI